MPDVTKKIVQIHFSCVCGSNVVYEDHFHIKWSDFPKHGIVRKKDKTTGEPFLLAKQHSETCHCNED